MFVDIGGQKFDLDTTILDGILNAMGQTSSDGLEHGFQFCQLPSGDITAGKKCTGNACSINITDCADVGGVRVGDFHSHPEVISFSLGDYMSSVSKAQESPGNKYLLCVSLLNEGVRCKALKKMPPKSVLLSIHGPDTDEEREKIKPYFTEKVNISKDMINKLKAGTPWEKIPAADAVIAIDEGDVVVPKPKKIVTKPASDKQSILMQAAANYTNTPTGIYPWGAKNVTQSVKTAHGIAMQPQEMPELVSELTQFVATDSVETPDPALIHVGEVAGYIGAISPIILTEKKDAEGKWKILDGRHRVAAWRAAGYQRMPVVFSKETEYK